eukprot:1145949-Pelagomonas_calceolata.AAC.2
MLGRKCVWAVIHVRSTCKPVVALGELTTSPCLPIPPAAPALPRRLHTSSWVRFEVHKGWNHQ